MQPLTPQAEERVTWEFQVQDELTQLEENITHGDAQDICMAQDSLMDESYAAKLSAKETAKKVLKAATAYNYYKDQIEKLTPSPEYGYSIQIRGRDTDANKTNWMNINAESAYEIIAFLQRFLHTSTPS